MASRPPRPSKSDTSTTRNRPAAPPSDNPAGGDLDAGATIKDSSLQRREIPSYSDSREARIAEAAYWRAERRGFAPGGELEDWLEAEKEIDKDRSSESGRSDSQKGSGQL